MVTWTMMLIVVAVVVLAITIASVTVGWPCVLVHLLRTAAVLL